MPAQLFYRCQAFLWNEISRQANEIDIIRYFITGLRQYHNCLKAISLLFHCFPGLFHCCLVIFHNCLVLFHCYFIVSLVCFIVVWWYFITVWCCFIVCLLYFIVVWWYFIIISLFPWGLFHCCLAIFYIYFITSLGASSFLLWCFYLFGFWWDQIITHDLLTASIDMLIS